MSSAEQYHDGHQRTEGRQVSPIHQVEPIKKGASSVTEGYNGATNSSMESASSKNSLLRGFEESVHLGHEASRASEEVEQTDGCQIGRPGGIAYTISDNIRHPMRQSDTDNDLALMMTAPRPVEESYSIDSGFPGQQSSSLSEESRDYERSSLQRIPVTRNMQDLVDFSSSVAESSLAGSSGRERTQTPLSPVTPNSKKSGPVVTISPVIRFEEDPEPLLAQRSSKHIEKPNLQEKLNTPLAKLSRRISDKKTNIFKTASKAISKINKIPRSRDGRHIELNIAHQKPLKDERTEKAYISNEIRSNKYNLWNFLPKQLVAQFSKLANFYFLCISILQLIPGLSTTGSYTTIVPLMFFVGISMAKEAYEDFRRHRLDKVDNNSTTNVLCSQFNPTGFENTSGNLSSTIEAKHWRSTKWQDIQVGDIVKVQRNEAVPADLVILHVDGMDGTAYVETMALDGETNLKNKRAVSVLSKSGRAIDNLPHCKARIVVEDPNLDLYSFQGRVTLYNETVPLTNSEILYRGSILRNTMGIIGICVYSGEESKIRMNATKNPRIKAPALQVAVNRVVVMIVIFVLALAIWNTAAYQIWKSDTERKAFYLINASVSFVPILVSFIILFNTMIPLSLYVSLEIIKGFQLLLMNDIEMFDESSNTPMEARTSTINEDLGQISHIFSDKTGTLTNNTMVFRKMSVAGIAWFHGIDLKDATTEAKANSPGHCPKVHGTTELLDYLRTMTHTDPSRAIRFFLLSIALCHTSTTEAREDGSTDFQSTSPDELALLHAAKALGYILTRNHSGNMTIEVASNNDTKEPTIEEYQVLQVLEFSSKRKRMSILVRMPDDRICVICKGADSTVTQLLKLSSLATEKTLKVQQRADFRKSMEAQEVIRRKSEQQARKNSMTRPSLNLGRPSLGGIGRPSLSANRLEPIRGELATRLKYQDPRKSTGLEGRLKSPQLSSISPMQQMNAHNTINQSNNRLDDKNFDLDEETIYERCFQHVEDFATEGLRTLLYGYKYVSEEDYTQWKTTYDEASTSLIDRQVKLETAAAQIEQNLELLGATAIEDKLQEGVPSTIDQLRRANIKIWMLTGDKRETAVNIGRSCRLIEDYSMLTILDHDSGDVERRISVTTSLLTHQEVAHSVVVVDGHTLSIIEAQGELYSRFIGLTVLVDTVICCRASPSQKASLVRSIRHKLSNATTLAIGDGANDIAMIQEAHVGIGITGKEGLQAARTSDYSIAQFRFLARLLLVHGRWNYIRTCKYTLGTFWKEMLFYLTQALYQRYNGYTGTSLYENWSLSLFNTLFTSLPVIFLGIFEKDLKAETLLAVPELYTLGQKNKGFSFKIYLGWVFLASTEAMIVFFLMLGLFGQGALFTTDNDNGIFGMGAITFSAVVIIIAVKLQVIELHYKTATSAIALILSIGGWFLWNVILSGVYKSNNFVYDVKDGFFHRWGKNALWWLSFILILISVWVFEIAVNYLKVVCKPSDVDVFQALEKDPVCWERIKAAAAVNGQRQDDGDKDVTSTDLALLDERGRTPQEQAKREGEVQALLDRRGVMDPSYNSYGNGNGNGHSGSSRDARHGHGHGASAGAGATGVGENQDQGRLLRKRHSVHEGEGDLGFTNVDGDAIELDDLSTKK